MKYIIAENESGHVLTTKQNWNCKVPDYETSVVVLEFDADSWEDAKVVRDKHYGYTSR